MSRFRSLEFNDGREEESLPAAPVVRNEAYYLAEARHSWELGEFEKALRSFSRILEENPRSAEGWIGQIRMFLELDRLPEARAWTDKALDQFPEYPELLAARSVILARQAEPDAGLALSDASLADSGVPSPFLWLARAEVLLVRGGGPADYCLERATALAPGDWCTFWMAARIRARRGQHAGALGLLQKALACDPSRPVLWAQRAESEIALGHLDDARRSCEQALGLQPDHPGAQRALMALRRSPLGRRLADLWRRMLRR